MKRWSYISRGPERSNGALKYGTVVHLDVHHRNRKSLNVHTYECLFGMAIWQLVTRLQTQVRKQKIGCGSRLSTYNLFVVGDTLQQVNVGSGKTLIVDQTCRNWKNSSVSSFYFSDSWASFCNLTYSYGQSPLLISVNHQWTIFHCLIQVSYQDKKTIKKYGKSQFVMVNHHFYHL